MKVEKSIEAAAEGGKAQMTRRPRRVRAPRSIRVPAGRFGPAVRRRSSVALRRAFHHHRPAVNGTTVKAMSTSPATLRAGRSAALGPALNRWAAVGTPPTAGGLVVALEHLLLPGRAVHRHGARSGGGGEATDTATYLGPQR